MKTPKKKDPMKTRGWKLHQPMKTPKKKDPTKTRGWKLHQPMKKGDFVKESICTTVSLDVPDCVSIKSRHIEQICFAIRDPRVRLDASHPWIVF
jgi:hypothetical protein